MTEGRLAMFKHVCNHAGNEHQMRVPPRHADLHDAGHRQAAASLAFSSEHQRHDVMVKRKQSALVLAN